MRVKTFKTCISKEFVAGSVRSEAIKEAVGLKRAKNAAAQETGFSSELSWITAHTASLEEPNQPLQFGFLTIQHKTEEEKIKNNTPVLLSVLGVPSPNLRCMGVGQFIIPVSFKKEKEKRETR